MMGRLAKGRHVAIGTTLLIFLTAFTIQSNAALLYLLARQHSSAGYPTAEGEVVKSEVEKDVDGESGTYYAAVVRYRYEVQGWPFESDQIRFTKLSWSGETARNFVAAHPVANRITVHYKPDDAADALLLTGVGGAELYLAMLTMPFNVVTIGAWVYWLRKSPTAGLHVIDCHDELRVRMAWFTPGWAAATTAVAACIIGTLPISSIGPELPLRVALLIWCLILIVVVIAYVLVASVLARGFKDLVLDFVHDTLTLPETCGRRESITIAFADLESVQTDNVSRQDSEGETQLRYAPTVRWRGRDSALMEARLTEWRSEERAIRFVDWLRERLKLDRGRGHTELLTKQPLL